MRVGLDRYAAQNENSADVGPHSGPRPASLDVARDVVSTVEPAERAKRMLAASQGLKHTQFQRQRPWMVHVGLASLLALSAAACSDSQAVQQPQQKGPPPAVPITATAVVTKDMPLEVSVIGAVEPYSTVAVRAQITGELTSVNFQQGDDVQAGQELFTLDRRPRAR